MGRPGPRDRAVPVTDRPRRQHVERLRAVHPGRDEEPVGGGQQGDHRRGIGVGSTFGFGPGLTMETVVLHSMPIAAN
ncbi:hypothetical protein B296_00039441 [Ensete ventricosum]|uniref:Uncharacterized protein n=1 Tax=Ensete ventricosum TaxID=4639 RepID=A0A426XRW4_ENSVE|nr:hypothetical protein B296_00039441 [Ensete ventricosum]